MQPYRPVTFSITRASVQEFVAYSMLAIGLLILPWYLHVYQPVAYIYFVSEDSWSEYITFVLWAMTTVMLVWVLVRSPEFRKPGHYAFAIAAFLIAMEEISWGQRIFGLSTPDVLRALNTQEELNLHNILESSKYEAYLGIAVIIAVAGMPVAAALIPPWRKFCNRWGIPLVPIRHWPLFAVPVYFIKDHHQFNLAPGYGYEVAELGLAVAVAVFTLSMFLQTRKTEIQQGFTAIAATSTLVVLASLLSIPLVQHYSDPQALRYGFITASTRTYPGRAMYRQAADVFHYTSTRPEFTSTDSSYYHGLVLQKLQRTDEAQEVFDLVLAREFAGQEWSENKSASHRRVGRILHAQNQIGQACQAYLQALKIDHEKLAGGSDPVEETMLRWSLAKTLFAMGQQDAAAGQVELAMQLNQSRSTQHKISLWHYLEKRNVSRGLLVPHVITPMEPACINGLNLLVTKGLDGEMSRPPQSDGVK